MQDNRQSGFPPNLDVDLSGPHCLAHGKHVPNGGVAPCVFPFRYRGRVFWGCITFDDVQVSTE